MRGGQPWRWRCLGQSSEEELALKGLWVYGPWVGVGVAVLAVGKGSPGSKNSSVKIWKSESEAEVGHQWALPTIPRGLSLTL